MGHIHLSLQESMWIILSITQKCKIFPGLHMFITNVSDIKRITIPNYNSIISQSIMMDFVSWENLSSRRICKGEKLCMDTNACLERNLLWFSDRYIHALRIVAFLSVHSYKKQTNKKQICLLLLNLN